MGKAARRDDGVGALPDDLLLDVLARVPDHADLLRCAGVCTRWLRLIADPAFLRNAGVLPEDAPDTSFVAGAFYQDSYLFHRGKGELREGSHDPPMFKRLYPWPGADWPLRFLVPYYNGRFHYLRWPSYGPMRLHIGSGWGWPLRFFVPNLDGLFNFAKPLASRRGLLLLRMLPTSCGELHLVVCDPLTGRRRCVPPLILVSNPELHGSDATGYAILTDTDWLTCGVDQDRRQASAFKVLVTTENSEDRLVYAYSYSSATDGWSAPIKCSQVSGLIMSGPRAGVVARGIVYWLYRDETHFYALGVSADATDVSLTKILPAKVDHHALRLQPPFPCVAGGKLSFAILDRRNGGMLDMWTKDDDTRWTHSNMMSKGAKGIKVFSFAEGRGALLVQDGHKHLFTLDLDNKKMEPVKCSTWDQNRLCNNRRDNYKCDGYLSCTACTYNSHVLYEMDWPSYILHLSAGICCSQVE